MAIQEDAHMSSYVSRLCTAATCLPSTEGYITLSLGDLQTSKQEHTEMLHAVSRVRVHTPYHNREQQSTPLHIIYGVLTLSMGSH